jgi:hypothetical protein
VLKWLSVVPGPVRPHGKVVERGALRCSEVGAEYPWLGGAAPVAETPCIAAATRAEGSTRQAKRIAFISNCGIIVVFHITNHTHLKRRERIAWDAAV